MLGCTDYEIFYLSHLNSFQKRLEVLFEDNDILF